MARNKQDIFELCHLRAQHEYRTGLMNEGWAVYAVYLDLTKPGIWSPTAKWGAEDNKDDWLDRQALPCRLGTGIPDPAEEQLVSQCVPQGQRWAKHWLTVPLKTDVFIPAPGGHPPCLEPLLCQALGTRKPLAEGAALWQHLRTLVASGSKSSSQEKDKLQQAPAGTWETLIP